MSYFSENYGNISYPFSTDNSPGLRNAQLGAIHAIGTYCTLQKQYDGLVVMPTGSGKTAVLMMTPFLCRADKALCCKKLRKFGKKLSLSEFRHERYVDELQARCDNLFS